MLQEHLAKFQKGSSKVRLMLKECSENMQSNNGMHDNVIRTFSRTLWKSK